MNILICVNRNYIVPVKVMLKSLSLHSSEQLDIYLLYSNLHRKYIEELSCFCMKECTAELHPIYVEKQIFDALPLTGWFPVEIYFRLIAPFILPENINRILWIDADIIVKKDIFDLYNVNLDEVAIGVVRDMGSRNLVSECCERLRLKNDSVYFNSGIVLFNLIAIRKYWTRESFINWMNGYYLLKLKNLYRRHIGIRLSRFNNKRK